MAMLGICVSLVAANVRSALQYRINILVEVLIGVIYQGTGFVFIWVVLSRFHAIAGWTLGDVAFLYGLRTTVDTLQWLATSFTGGFDWLVRQGEFDRYLVRPLPPLLQLMTSRFTVADAVALLYGIALFLVATTLVKVDWSPAAVAYLGLAIVGGCLIEAALFLIIAALAFRLLSTGGLFFLIGHLLSSFGNYPLTIFGGTLRLLLTFGLPLAFVAYFPATVLLNRTGELSVPPLVAYLAPLAGIVWFIPAYLLFHREMRTYQSAGH